MSRPEAVGPPELFYNEEEAERYTHNSRIMEIQAEMSERAIELLEIEDAESSFILVGLMIPFLLCNLGHRLWIWN
jgi:18S rRNA (guanine1575-N7)-methyltransferase